MALKHCLKFVKEEKTPLEVRVLWNLANLSPLAGMYLLGAGHLLGAAIFIMSSFVFGVLGNLLLENKIKKWHEELNEEIRKQQKIKDLYGR